MRIAFDCKGTLLGYNQDKVARLFRILQDMGHEMFIWSSMVSYTFEARELHMLNVDSEHLCSKYSREEAEEYNKPVMDIAVDDDAMYNDYLAAQRFVDVAEIPSNVEEFAKQLVESALNA